MPLESATFISGLVETNPTQTDSVRQGDDHIRLIKAVLKSTFPNLGAAVQRTAADLNNGPVPIGGIIMWSGTVANIPAGWALCDGQNGTPDLRGRFVVGAGGAGHPYQPGATGGSETVTLTGANIPQHAHGVGSLAVDPAGSHQHNFSASTDAGGNSFTFASRRVDGTNEILIGAGGSISITPFGAGGSWTRVGNGGGTSSADLISYNGVHAHSLSGTTGIGGTHSHALSGSTATFGSTTPSAVENRPPFFSLAYIMRTT